MSGQDIDLLRGVLAGREDPETAEIVACEAAIRAAQLAADVEALDQLIADDLLFTGPAGTLGTKAEDLEAHGSGVVRFRAHEPEEWSALRARSLPPPTRYLAPGGRGRLASGVSGPVEPPGPQERALKNEQRGAGLVLRPQSSFRVFQ